jgi:hypothetical protein
MMCGAMGYAFSLLLQQPSAVASAAISAPGTALQYCQSGCAALSLFLNFFLEQLCYGKLNLIRMLAL